MGQTKKTDLQEVKKLFGSDLRTYATNHIHHIFRGSKRKRRKRKKKIQTVSTVQQHEIKR